MVVRFGTGLPKMAETLVAFAEPLLVGVPETEEAWRARLYMAACVWNGVVSGRPAAELTAQLQRELGWPPEGPGLVGHLIERKHRLFADDARFIFDVRTRQAGARVHVLAASGLAQ